MTNASLDTLLWTALTGRQAAFSAGNADARRFMPDIGPLAAIRDTGTASREALARLVSEQGLLALMQPGDPIEVPGTRIAKSAAGVQMVFTGSEAALDAIAAALPDPRIEPLGPADYPQMLALATLTEPGPFCARTGDLGQFWVIREGGAILAMAGQRIATDSHVEVSAVCTHPDARGHGYAALLSRKVAGAILADGRTPILHSYANNTPALALYVRLGFAVRCAVTVTMYAPPA